ncbi:MAG: hypothetical protein ABSB75_02425 [Candidatus Limnocylindrales bacterium]
MIQLAVVASVAALLGGLVAVTARDSRLVVLGLLVAMVAAPLASSPAPSVLTIAFRVLGALLAAYLLWVAARDRSISSEGSGIGAAAEMAVAAAVFSVGWFAVPVKPLPGPLAAQAAGISLAVLAVVPLAGRNILRAGAGLAILAIGASLLFDAWVGPPSALQQVVLMALLVGVLGSTSLLISPIEEPAANLEPPAPAPAGMSAEIERGEATVPTVAAVVAAAAGEPDEDIGPKPDRKPAASVAQMPAAEAGETDRASRARERAKARAKARAAARLAAPEVSPTTAAMAPPTAPQEKAAGAATDAAPADSAVLPTARTSARRPGRSVRDGAPVRPLPLTTADDAALGDETASRPVTPAPSQSRRLRPREPRGPRGPRP